MVDYRSIALSFAVNAYILQLPQIASWVVNYAGGIIASVEVLEDAGEDFGLFIREVDSFPFTEK